jgi:hypothetical protein
MKIDEEKYMDYSKLNISEMNDGELEELACKIKKHEVKLKAYKENGCDRCYELKLSQLLRNTNNDQNT